jgi:hypothetical protein
MITTHSAGAVCNNATMVDTLFKKDIGNGATIVGKIFKTRF